MVQSINQATSPDWYMTATSKLEVIEQHADEYACPEDGDLAPTQSIFLAVRGFLDQLKEQDIMIEEPRFYVSPDGHIILGLGGKKQSIDLRFQPGVHYYYKDINNRISEGDSELNALEIIRNHFRL